MDTSGPCSHCGNHNTVSKIEITQNGERKELVLCPACLKAMFADVEKFLASEPGDFACSDCGSTWEEVKKTRHLGCPACWDRFAVEIDQLREKKTPPQPYRGKVPQRLGRQSEGFLQREALKAQLHEAIVAEEYEKAARLRDELKKWEGQP